MLPQTSVGNNDYTRLIKSMAQTAFKCYNEKEEGLQALYNQGVYTKYTVYSKVKGKI